jgi:peptidyl-prolyl cis-trans isomerase A (cyclophilin A)
MRSTTSAILLLALAGGCEHKSKKNEPANKPAGGSGAPTATPGSGSANSLDSDMKPEPVAKADGEVRPPTAADLAEYTKDIPGEGTLIAKIETPMGTLNCELYGDKAPMTVANFVGLATGKKPWLNPKTNKVEKGVPYFDGIIFHRVIPNFMLQTGDPLGKGFGGPGYNFDDEFAQGLKMDAGALAMANAGPGTNGSQFFIMEGSRPDLVGRHSIFGQCKELDLIKQIARVPKQCPDCNPDDPKAAAPATPIAMTKVTITKGKL